jgi:hypothetical protein
LYDLVEVYLDESGDLGFTRGSSRYLVIAATIATERVNFDRIVKKGNEKLKVKGKCRAEVKFNNSDDWIKHYYIDKYCETSCKVVWGAVLKNSTKADLKRKKDKLYNYLCGRVMAPVFESAHTKKFNVIIDKRAGGRAERNDFDGYLEGILDNHHQGPFPPSLRLSHFDSCNNAGLRVHDFVVGSIFRYLERKDAQYYEKLKPKVIWGEKLW